MNDVPNADVQGLTPDAPAEADFVRPTTGFWQDVLPADHPAGQAAPPYRFGYPVRLPDGRILELPLRRLPSGDRAVASLIANQASLEVCDILAGFMAEEARAAGAEIVIGVPTLGLMLAPRVAGLLGHPHYVPLGYSRKFWYRDELSEPVHSITSPEESRKAVFVDPNMLPRLAGRRAVVVDDAVSSGTTVTAVLKLLGRLDCDVAAVVVAMKQGTAWRDRLQGALMPEVRGVFSAPLFTRVPDGWTPVEEA